MIDVVHGSRQQSGIVRDVVLDRRQRDANTSEGHQISTVLLKKLFVLIVDNMRPRLRPGSIDGSRDGFVAESVVKFALKTLQLPVLTTFKETDNGLHDEHS